MKQFFAIVMSMLMIACFMPSMAFAEQTTYDTLGALASGKSIAVDFSYQENVTAKGTTVTIDGEYDSVTKWVDAWVYQDTTIKNVTFENGATFNVGVNGVTLSLENCTFKACDQSKLANEGHQSKTNSGGGCAWMWKQGIILTLHSTLRTALPKEMEVIRRQHTGISMTKTATWKMPIKSGDMELH